MQTSYGILIAKQYWRTLIVIYFVFSPACFTDMKWNHIQIWQFKMLHLMIAETVKDIIAVEHSVAWSTRLKLLETGKEINILCEGKINLSMCCCILSKKRLLE